MRLLEMSKWGKRNKDTHCLGLRKGSRRVALCARFIDKEIVLEQTQHPSAPPTPPLTTRLACWYYRYRRLAGWLGGHCRYCRYRRLAGWLAGQARLAARLGRSRR